MQPFDRTQVSSTLSWMEEELRHTKGVLARLQTQHEQLLEFVRDHLDQFRISQDALSAMKAQLAQILVIDDAVKSVQASNNQLREQHMEFHAEVDRRRRADLTEVERIRQVLSETWQRVDQLRSDLDPLTTRVENLAEAQPRMVESIQALQHVQDDLAQQITALGQRFQSGAEREKRVDDRFEDVQAQLNAVEKRDEQLADSQKIAADRVVNLEERMALVLAEEEERRSLDEQVHLVRVALTRGEKQIAELAAQAAEQRQQLENVEHYAKQVDTRRSLLGERLDETNASIEQLRTDFTDLLADFGQMEEQHRVRLMTELTQQVKDVRARIAKAKNR